MAHFDVLVIGSGFGGSVAALRLSEKGYRVGVLESGKRWTSDTLPKSNWDARKFFWFPKLGMRGIQRISLLKNVLILSGAGVGGGSLVWANVCYRPHDAFYEDPQWGDVTDWRSELEPFYDLAERMLGVNTYPGETNGDRVLRDIAKHFHVEDTYQPTPVAVYFGEPRVEVSDPYFGGRGPTRTGCRQCGGCMVGCRYNAKNTLDRNYLYLAEKSGAVVMPGRQVVDVCRRDEGGYEVTTVQPGARFRKSKRVETAQQVVIAAGALGTSKLLLQLRGGSLPGISAQVGYQFRTNSEAILGATASDSAVDYSHGVAITSSIHPEPQTHIEVVRYPKGSDSMGLLTSVLVDGGGSIPRWVRFLAAVVRQPAQALSVWSISTWAERSIILLVMQSLDNSLRLIRKGQRFSTVPSEGKPNPTYIPIANEAARVAAQSMGGNPRSSLNEALLDVPMTAHILGGAAVASSPERGVVDGYHRMFGYPDLHVVDGSAIGANLGVNPSLSITALAERAMAMWPNKGEEDVRPTQDKPYQPMSPIRPRHPAVPEGAPAALL